MYRIGRMMKNADVVTIEQDLTILSWHKGKFRKGNSWFYRRNVSFRPYFEALIKSLDCTESDQLCFYALSVLLTMTTNPCKFILIDFLKFDLFLSSCR
jgi:hypothetical protein